MYILHISLFIRNVSTKIINGGIKFKIFSMIKKRKIYETILSATLIKSYILIN